MDNKLVIISTVFILGLMFCLTYKTEDVVETSYQSLMVISSKKRLAGYSHSYNC